MEEITNLPDDIIFHDVLPRLPAAVLLSFKRVCKKWLYVLSNDAVFVDRQIVLSKPKNLRFVFSSVWPGDFIPRFIGVEVSMEKICTDTFSYTLCYNNIITLSESNRKMRIMGSCNGLVLMRKNLGSSTIYVVNPTIKESVTLPQFHSHPIRFNVGGIGYDPSSKKYKVVVLFCDNETLLCRIITLGSTTWREVRTPAIDKVTRLVNPAIVTTGFLHFGGHGGCPWHVDVVLSVDMCSESVTVEELPFGATSLWQYQDNVAATDPTDIGFPVHIMHYHAGHPVERNRENLELDVNRKTFHALGSYMNGELIIFKESRRMRLWFYHTKSHLFKEIETPWGNNPEAQYAHMRLLFYQYVSTLVSPIAVAGVEGNNGDKDPDIQP